MGNFLSKNRDNKLFETMKQENNLDNPRPFSSITDQELATFVGVFIPGGHAPLTDLGDNPDLGRILLYFHNNNKPTGQYSRESAWCASNSPILAQLATLCHGPFALLSTKVAPGSTGFAYKGYKITSWSDVEESLVESLKGGKVPVKVESTLAQEGAEMVTGFGQKVGSITTDRELISGSNPMAANGIGEEFVNRLKAATI